MNTNTTGTNKVDLILARLILSQSILEESDFFEGHNGYNYDRPDWWFHPRHEREALVVYLLLTCFDLLGQEKSFITFENWLKSKKVNHILERKTLIDSLSPDATHQDAACAMMEQYQSLYGVRNAFYEGINNLPEKSKDQLLSSMELVLVPEFEPNVSKRGLPLEDKELEFELKLKHIYERRNRFTHRLEQQIGLSTPTISKLGKDNSSSWLAKVENSKLSYLGGPYETKLLNNGGAYYYSLNQWPFVLFEVLYAAIGVPFDRTSIRLKFRVMCFNNANPGVVVNLDGVDHELLKDVDSLEKYVWSNHSTPSK